MGQPYQAELNRMLAAHADILTRISASDLAEMEAYEKRVLTPYEKAEEDAARKRAMEENRDKPSI
jgi:hypothetical protein